MQTTPNAAPCACEFCDEFAGGHSNRFALQYDIAARALLDTGCFRVVPSLGQIIEGHLLIIPVKHVCAMADLRGPVADHFESLCQRVGRILNDAYSRCIFFEHGMRGLAPGGCGIDHAHMHAVPVAACGVLETLEREFSGFRIDSLQEITRMLPDQSYLYFEGISGDRRVFPVTSLPSQYMRKLVAESIGKKNWDWRASGYESELVSTMRRLSPIFSSVAA